MQVFFLIHLTGACFHFILINSTGHAGFHSNERDWTLQVFHSKKTIWTIKSFILMNPTEHCKFFIQRNPSFFTHSNKTNWTMQVFILKEPDHGPWVLFYLTNPTWPCRFFILTNLTGPAQGTLEWWISGLMLNPLFLQSRD